LTRRNPLAFLLTVITDWAEGEGPSSQFTEGFLLLLLLLLLKSLLHKDASAWLLLQDPVGARASSIIASSSSISRVNKGMYECAECMEGY